MLVKQFILLTLVLATSALSNAFSDQQAWEEWLEVEGKRFPLYNYASRKGQPRGSVLLMLSAADGQGARIQESGGPAWPDYGWNAVAVVIDFELDDDSYFENE